MKPVVLLDVHMEDLVAILSQKNWDVRTVTKEVGSADDEEIIRYTDIVKCVVVTANDELVSKLLAAGLLVVSIDAVDRAKIIHEKLERIEIPSDEQHVSSENTLEFCKQHFYLL